MTTGIRICSPDIDTKELCLAVYRCYDALNDRIIADVELRMGYIANDHKIRPGMRVCTIVELDPGVLVDGLKPATPEELYNLTSREASCLP